MKFIFIIVLYTLPFCANCQNVSKEGRVIRGHVFIKFNKTDTVPVQGAKITAEITSDNNTYVTKSSDPHGEFILTIPDNLIIKRFKIRVDCVGCIEKVIVMKTGQLPTEDLRIVMAPFVINDDFE